MSSQSRPPLGLKLLLSTGPLGLKTILVTSAGSFSVSSVCGVETSTPPGLVRRCKGGCGEEGEHHRHCKQRAEQSLFHKSILLFFNYSEILREIVISVKLSVNNSPIEFNSQKIQKFNRFFGRASHSRKQQLCSGNHRAKPPPQCLPSQAAAQRLCSGFFLRPGRGKKEKECIQNAYIT